MRSPSSARSRSSARPGLDRAAAEREHARRLVLAELEQIAAREDEPVLLAQPLERREQLGALLRGEYPPLRGRSRAPRKLVRRAKGEPSRRPSARRRLRASLATMARSQGRTGAPRRKRSGARHALTSPVWAASSASAAFRVIRYAVRAISSCSETSTQRRHGRRRRGPVRRARPLSVVGSPLVLSTPPELAPVPREVVASERLRRGELGGGGAPEATQRLPSPRTAPRPRPRAPAARPRRSGARARARGQRGRAVDTHEVGLRRQRDRRRSEGLRARVAVTPCADLRERRAPSWRGRRRSRPLPRSRANRSASS